MNEQKKNKVVVVDDHEDMRILIKAILTRKGYKVATDATGEITKKSAIEKAGLILLDINLEKRDGRQICEDLKKRAATKHIPIILVSAIAELPNIYHFCGAEDYLSKPFSAAELVSKVEHYLHAA